MLGLKNNMNSIKVMGPRFFECLRCNDMVYCKPDGILRWCRMACVGIDHTELYTRFLGNGVKLNVYDENKKLIGKHSENIDPFF